MSRVSVVAAAHPFRSEQTHLAVPEGATLEEILSQVQPREALRAMAHVFVEGDYIPRERWARHRPSAGHTVTIRMVPLGGGGGEKNPLRTVLTIAVIAAAAYVAGPQGAAFFGSSLTAAAAGAAVSLAGMWMVNQIAPLTNPNAISHAAGEQASQTYSLTGGRNQLSPYGVVPLVLGRHRIVPPFAAMPYTELVGDDQYLRLLFNLGYGPLTIDDMRIGETPMQQDGEFQFTDVQLETRYGDTDEPALSLFDTDVYEESLSVLLEASADWTLRTTQLNTDEIVVDITFPQGLVAFDDNGGKLLRRVDVAAEYRPVGETTWLTLAPGLEKPAQPITTSYIYGMEDTENPLLHYTWCIARVVIDASSGVFETVYGHRSTAPIAPPTPAGKLSICTYPTNTHKPTPTDERDAYFITNNYFTPSYSGVNYRINISAGYLPDVNFSLEAKTAGTLRRSLRAEVATGQYEVRLKRLTTDSTSEKIFDKVYFTTLRSVSYSDPVTLPGIAKVAMRIRATDQLNGVVDQFNCIAQTECLDWDADLAQWVQRPTSNPASLYRYLLQGPMNPRPVADSRIDLISLQSWAEFCNEQFLEFNAVIDFRSTLFPLLNMVAAAGRGSFSMLDGKYSAVWDRPQSTPVQMFTPRNSRGFSGERVFQREVHALKVQYMDKDEGYRRAERIVYADGYDELSATEFENVELMGVTSARQAWRAGRYHLAVLQLRPERYSISVDIEHLVCTRGDLVRVAHDVPLWGVSSGRLKSVTLDGLGKGTGALTDEALTFEAGTSYGMEFRLADGTTARVDVTADPSDPHAVLFVDPLATPPAAGDLFVFGEAGLETVDLLVTRIEMQSDLAARLEMADASPAVYTAYSGVIPAFDPQITIPPELRTPPVPVITGVRSDESVLLRNGDGSLTTRVLISLQQSASAYAAAGSEVAVQFRPSGVGPYRAASAFGVTTTEISITELEDGEDYDFRLRTVSQAGQLSDWVVVTHSVVGKTTPPPDVSGFTSTTTRDGVWLTWLPVEVADLREYEIRHGADWDSGTLEERTRSTSLLLQGLSTGAHAWWIKAVDVVGNYSVNAVQAPFTVVAPEAPVFSASVSGTDYRLSWSRPLSTYPISTYEVRYGVSWAESALVTQTASLGVSGPVEWTGARTFWLVAVDEGLNVGASASVALNVSAPAAPQVQAQLIVAKAALEWTVPTSSLPIAEYAIRHGVDWATGMPVIALAGTSYRVPIDWTGERTFWVAAIDARGNVGPAGSVPVAVNVPQAPVVSGQVAGDTLVLTWTAPLSSLPLVEFEVGYNGTSMGRVMGTTMRLPVDWTGARDFWVRAYDINNNVGAKGNFSLEISPPSIPIVTQRVIDNNVMLYWTPAAGTLPVATYEIRRGATWASATPIGRTSGLFSTVFETAGDTYTYWVAGIDSAGNEGTPGQVMAAVNQPPDYVLQADVDSTFHGMAMNLVTDPVGLRRCFGDATELAYWTAATGNTATQNTDAETGTYSGLLTSTLTTPLPSGNTGTVYFSSPPIFAGRTIRVLVRAKQPATSAAEFAVAFSTSVGNSGWQYFTPTADWAWYEFTYSVPTDSSTGDYVGIWADTSGAGLGVLVNRVIVREDGAVANALYLPVDPHQSWEGHFTGNSWTAPDDQVTAGLPYYLQPGSLSGYYEEVIDQGVTLGGMKIMVTEEGATLAGSITKGCTISVSNTSGSGPWTDYEQWELFASDFRWVKVRLTMTGADNSAIYRLTRLNIRLDAKLRNDAGTVAAVSTDVGGTEVTFTTAFIDVTSIKVSAKSTTPLTAVYDFTDAPYPTSFFVYLFDASGNRASGTVSWDAKGY